MMLRTAILCACAALLLQSSDAAPKQAYTIQAPHNGPIAIIPADSFVQFKKSNARNLEYFFVGRFVLTGTYSYGANGWGGFMASIVPDADVAAHLPSFANGVGGAREIFIKNPEVFAKAVIPKEQLAKLKKKGAPRATGRIVVWADNLYVMVQCGYPWYSARFISVYKPASVVLAKASDFDHC